MVGQDDARRLRRRSPIRATGRPTRRRRTAAPPASAAVRMAAFSSVLPSNDPPSDERAHGDDHRPAGHPGEPGDVGRAEMIGTQLDERTARGASEMRRAAASAVAGENRVDDLPRQSKLTGSTSTWIARRAEVASNGPERLGDGLHQAAPPGGAHEDLHPVESAQPLDRRGPGTRDREPAGGCGLERGRHVVRDPPGVPLPRLGDDDLHERGERRIAERPPVADLGLVEASVVLPCGVEEHGMPRVERLSDDASFGRSRGRRAPRLASTAGRRALPRESPEVPARGRRPRRPRA